MSKIMDARQILKDLGMPKEQQNEMSALTLLALCSVGPKDSWSNAKRASKTISKDIMVFTAEKYHKKYAPNTRETFRRHVLHQFVQANIADYNPDNPELPTNSPKAHYAISQEALTVIKKWGSREWINLCDKFKSKSGNLFEIYQGRRKTKMMPLELDGEILKISPGKHNEIQIAVIKEFAPRFAQTAKVIYFGDTANKSLYLNTRPITDLDITITEHNKLPDIILYDSKRKWFFLVEVVTSHGPMSAKRVIELEKMFLKSSAKLIFVSAFPDFSTFRKHLKDIAWETEVWIAQIPEHMIHFNGNKFLNL